ncbi:MAG TPA: peptidylprolyl isomerase [Bryobacteraceae bacterium]|nr:peptidylprolyl isomerase [Bryobacteraceae bacterium]
MVFVRLMLLIVPVACLLAQTSVTKPVQIQGLPAGAKQPTVTLTQEPAPAPPAAVSPDKVVLQVGTEKLTAAELDRIVNALPEQYRKAARGPGRRQFAENIVKIKLLAQEARRRKMDQSEQFQAQIAFQGENLLAGLLFQDLAASAKIEDVDVHRFYDAHKTEYEQVKARHILVRFKGSGVPLKADQKDLTEEEALAKAQEIRQQLLAGGDFDAIAKKESDDPGSASQGGELGFFKHGQMVAPFEQAAFAQAPGKVSEPVKSQFGYHLILVEDKQTKTFDEMRPQIERQLRPEAAQKAIDDLRKQNPVVLDSTYFGPAE